MCIDIMDIWFGIVMGNFYQFLTELSAHDRSVFSFLDYNFSNFNGFSPNLVCAMILWISSLVFLSGKLHQFLTELSAHNTSLFYFQNNNLNKSQWFFTKFDMCIDVVEICFGIAHCQISSIFDRVICP